MTHDQLDQLCTRIAAIAEDPQRCGDIDAVTLLGRIIVLLADDPTLSKAARYVLEITAAETLYSCWWSSETDLGLGLVGRYATPAAMMKQFGDELADRLHIDRIAEAPPAANT